MNTGKGSPVRRLVPMLALALIVVGLLVIAGGSTDTGVARAATPGRILFGHLGDIWMSHDGSNSAITQGGRYWGQPDWAPDGSRLALVGWGTSSTDIFTVAPDDTDLRQISRPQSARNNEWMFYPRYSPDGQTLAYLSDRTSQYTMLWTMNADGSNQRQLTRPRGTLDAYDSYSWSPDGAYIAATGFSGKLSQIYLMNISRPDSARAITNEAGGAYDPSWSPDGHWLTYAVRDDKRYLIKALYMEGDGDDTPVTLLQADTARSPRWSPNGSALAFIARAGNNFELFVSNITFDSDGLISAGRASQLTTRLGVDATSGLSWIP